MKRSLIIICIALCLTGCLHKSVMLDEADNVFRARICSCDGKERLVTLESVFQAVSKESRGGFTRISGVNDQRISVYDTDDGQLVARIKTGIQTKKPVEFLGCSRGGLWFYSAEDGIHSRDPGTLDIMVSQDSILGINPELKDNLARCEWYQLKQYFQFNDITGNVTLTDRQGYRYILDTETLKASKINFDYRDFDPRSDQNLATSVQSPLASLSISGDLRRQVLIDGKEASPGLTFLDGKFIIDRNPARIINSVEKMLSAKMTEAEMIYREVMKLNSIGGGTGPNWGTRERDLLSKWETERHRTERIMRDLESCQREITSDGFSYRYTRLLSTDSVSFFVFHRSGTEKDARVMISRVRYKDPLELTEFWNTEIEGLFFDPSAARETSSFRQVFSKGDPDFGFSFFDLSDDRLMIIWMLHACCLDVESGKVLWKFRI